LYNTQKKITGFLLFKTEGMSFPPFLWCSVAKYLYRRIRYWCLHFATYNSDISNTITGTDECTFRSSFNPLNVELNPVCHLLALLGAHHILHVCRIRVKLLTLRTDFCENMMHSIELGMQLVPFTAYIS